jgi:DNA replication protein DnaC
MHQMKSINTLAFSNISIIGKRTCKVCGTEVPIIRTTRNGEVEEISECLNCENKKIENEMIAFKEAADKRRAERIFEDYSLIPIELLDASFDSYIPQNESTQAAKEKCKWFAEHFGETGDIKNLLLQGSYGLGKSHLSFCIAKHVKSLGKTVIFITMPELLNAIRDSYSNKKFSELEILDACIIADLLILDDLGAEYVRSENGQESWAGDKLLQIVNSRSDKHTVYTTNYKSRQLAEKYGVHGGRIISRMMKGTYTVKLEGKDYRIQQAKKVQGHV